MKSNFFLRLLLLVALLPSEAFAGGYIDSMSMGSLGLKTQASAPATPSSGYTVQYVLSSDGKLYSKDSAGVAHLVPFSGAIVNADLSGSAGITNANLASMSQGTFKGRAASSGSGTPVDLTGTQATAMLNTFTTSLQGLVPAPGSVNGYALKDDGTWGVAGFANPLTTLGDIMYENATPAAARLAGNTTTTKKFLSQTGNGSVSAPPAWGQPAFSDITGTASASQLPNPTSSTLGGVQSYAAVTNQWINSISTSGVPSSSRPSFSDISGTAASAQLPTAQVSAPGAVAADSCLTHNFLVSINAGGTISCSQPSFSDITGSVTAAQLPNPSATTLGGVKSYASVLHQWINAISTSGAPSSSQPACADLSNGAASCSTDTTNASNISSGTLALARGGTGADLSATGGTSQVLKQTSTGGAVTVARLACSDLSNSSASCSTDATNAANISSGTLPAGRLPTPTISTLGGMLVDTCLSHNFVTATTTTGDITCAQPSFSDVSGTLGLGAGGTGQTTAGGAFSVFYKSVATTLGDVVYGGTSGAPTRLAGDTSNTRKFLREQSAAGVAAAPVWDTLLAADVPTLNQNTTGSAGSLSTTFGSGVPLFGQGTGVPTVGTVTGNTTKVATSTGALTSGNCAKWDASGNIVDAGAACGGGGGASIGNSSVVCDTPSGYGSTGTKVRKYTNCASNGTDITYTADASNTNNGDKFVINTAGLYAIVREDGHTSSVCRFGFSVNASSTSTDLSGLASSQYKVFADVSAGNSIANAVITWFQYFAVNDIVRAHDDNGIGLCNRADAKGRFSIHRIL